MWNIFKNKASTAHQRVWGKVDIVWGKVSNLYRKCPQFLIVYGDLIFKDIKKILFGHERQMSKFCFLLNKSYSKLYGMAVIRGFLRLKKKNKKNKKTPLLWDSASRSGYVFSSVSQFLHIIQVIIYNFAYIKFSL